MSRFLLKKNSVPVVLDASGPAFAGFTAGGTLTHPGGGSPSIALCAMHYNSAGINGTSPTYGGTSMLSLYNYSYTSGMGIYIFYLMNPPSGNQTVHYYCSSGGYATANSYTFNNCASVQVAGSSTGSTASGTTSAITTGDDNSLHFFVQGDNSIGTLAVGGGATSLYSKGYVGGVNYPGLFGILPGTSSTWTYSGASGTNGHAAILMNAA